MKSNHLLFLIVICLAVFLTSFNSVLAITVEVSATVPGCGDDAIGLGEQCDGSNLDGASCATQGFISGSLSCTSLCLFNTSACTSNGGGGGGSSSGNVLIPATNVVFTGKAYPKSTITLLKDAQISATTIADSNANFQMTISGLSGGNYIFSVYGEDSNGVRSSLFTFPISITSGITTKIGNIFIAPTIAVDKSEVKKGDNIAIFGQSAPTSEITININSEEEFFIKKISDENGVYLLNFDTYLLEMGKHNTRSKATLSGEITEFSKIVNFFVGTKNVLALPFSQSSLKGDLNDDKRVNLIDFSIGAYWYRQSLSAIFIPTEIEQLNGDGKVDLVDFSIMAYSWTG